MNKFRIVALFSFLLAGCLALPALAQPTAPVTTPEAVDEEPLEAVQLVVQLIQQGEWALAIGVGLFLLLWAARVTGLQARLPDWFSTARGDAVYDLVLALALSMGLALVSGAEVTFSLILGAVGAAVSALGFQDLLSKMFRDESSKSPAELPLATARQRRS